jgi:hypothetical protein
MLLHFTEHHRHVPSYDHLVPDLARHVRGGYSKTKLDFRCNEDGWRDAVRRARLMAPEGEEAQTDPSTGMWRLALGIGGSE